MEKREGQVKDLKEKLDRGEITVKEIKKTLEERRLTEKAILKGAAWGYVAWGILCFLPAVAKFSGLAILSFLTQLAVIEFPTIVIYLAIALFIAAIPLAASGWYYNIKKGGCHSEDDTIILLKRGPYKIIRHPGNVAWSIFLATIPIILGGYFSAYAPFTILTVIGIAEVVALHYYASVKEEGELDVRKWGDEYREYMKEVPRWNIFRGLWNLKGRR